jgi:hypothetical protein
MTGPEHNREAEQLVTQARDTAQAFALESSYRYAQTIAGTQLHAMPALAATTGTDPWGRGRWHRVL